MSTLTVLIFPVWIVLIFLTWRVTGSSKTPKIVTPEQFSLPSPNEWTEDDLRRFKAFLDCPAGKKFIDRSRLMVAQSCINSCADTFHTQHSAGMGHGMAEFLKWQLSLASDEMLKTLSQPTGAQVENTSEAFGQTSLLEKLSP